MTPSPSPSARARPEIALLLSTYQKPWHLKQVLTSIAVQEGVEGRMELVVTDDGSTDETPEIVRRFAESVPFPVSFTTHRHEAFHLAQCRNEGVRASTAPYLLFLDGDCVLPPDHVRKQLDHRREAWALGGFCCCFDEATSTRFNEDVVRSGRYIDWAPPSQLRALAKRARHALFYRLVRHPSRPSLPGGNTAVWRSDFERINGFDENFRGWGGEDDDLARRLRRIGVRIGSSLHWTNSYHLWHPRVASAPARVGEGRNIPYLHRPCRLTRCVNGLVKRRPDELAIRLAAAPAHPDSARALLGPHWSRAHGDGPAEIEVLFLPGSGRFSGRADCNLLVVLEDGPGARRLAHKAHLLVSDAACRGRQDRWRFPLCQFDQALAAVR